MGECHVEKYCIYLVNYGGMVFCWRIKIMVGIDFCQDVEIVAVLKLCSVLKLETMIGSTF